LIIFIIIKGRDEISRYHLGLDKLFTPLIQRFLKVTSLSLLRLSFQSSFLRYFHQMYLSLFNLKNDLLSSLNYSFLIFEMYNTLKFYFCQIFLNSNLFNINICFKFLKFPTPWFNCWNSFFT